MAIGPTRMPGSVLRQLAQQPAPIQQAEFLRTLGDCAGGIRRLHGGRDGAAIVAPGTGTAGMEAVAVSYLQPGMPVAVLTTGYWGHRWAEICRRLGASVYEVVAPPRGPVALEAVEDLLAAKKCALLFATHVDSSTGLMVDLARATEVAHRRGAMLIADAICGAGADRLEQADWDMDVVLSATPKAIGVPAGLFLVTLSKAATRILRERSGACRSLALDLQPWLDVMTAAESGRFGYFQSPAGNLVLALAEGLRLIFAETVPARLARHQELAAELRRELERIGIDQVVTDPRSRANGVTVALYPAGSGPELLERVAERGVFLPTGTHPDLATRSFRIGHLGWVTREDVTATLQALEGALGRR